MELGRTSSVCPECLKILPATLYEADGKVWMRKVCPEHGEFQELYLGSYEWYRRAQRYALDGRGVENPQVTKENPLCPQDCGLCRLHLSHTALANLVLTNRCDLACWYCLPPDEEVMVKGRGLCRIGDIAREVFAGGRPEPAGEGEACQASGIYVLGGEGGRVRWLRVTRLYRRKYGKTIYRVTTRTGKRIRVTEDHPIIVYERGRLVRRRVKGLRAGEILLTVHRLPEEEGEVPSPGDGPHFGNFLLDPLARIDPVDPVEEVYDLEVDSPEHTFIGGEGVLVSNCFFYAQRLGYVYEPTIQQIDEMFRILKEERPIPCNAVQLTGGEPCLREDLIEIVKLAKSHGFDHIQLNTNGIRLALQPELVRRVREAGVNTLYLSFDGVSEETNPKNHWEFPLVLESCRRDGPGIVLVPTILKGVNDHEVGDIVRYALRNLDVVRSVNFQPVSLVGRMSRQERDKYRITIPDVIKRLEEQTNGELTLQDFFPVPTALILNRFIEALTGRPGYELSSHFACGAATYVFEEDGRMIPITRFVDVEGFLEYLREKTEELRRGKSKTLMKLKLLVSLGKFIDSRKKPKDLKLSRLIYQIFVKRNYSSLGQFHLKSLFIGMMHFMDLYNYDLERVKRCCIHYVMSDGRVVPFCAFNVIPEWYRDKDQESQGIPIEEWERRTGRRLSDDLYKRDKERLKQTEAYRRFQQEVREIRRGLGA